MTQGTAATQAGPQITVHPQRALADAPVQIRLVDFPPLQLLTLRAKMRDPAGGVWASYTIFQTDPQGSVDVATQAPLSGTYDLADPMGLFWSMLPHWMTAKTIDTVRRRAA